MCKSGDLYEFCKTNIVTYGLMAIADLELQEIVLLYIRKPLHSYHICNIRNSFGNKAWIEAGFLFIYEMEFCIKKDVMLLFLVKYCYSLRLIIVSKGLVKERVHIVMHPLNALYFRGHNELIHLDFASQFSL